MLFSVSLIWRRLKDQGALLGASTSFHCPVLIFMGAKLILTFYLCIFNVLISLYLGSKARIQHKVTSGADRAVGYGHGLLSWGRGSAMENSMTTMIDAPTTVDIKYVSSASKGKRDVVEKFVEKMGGKRTIQRILVANNGMAATKAIMSMRQWAYTYLGDERAIEFVAMATGDDLNANAEFVRLADTYVEVPSGSNKVSDYIFIIHAVIFSTTMIFVCRGINRFSPPLKSLFSARTPKTA